MWLCTLKQQMHILNFNNDQILLHVSKYYFITFNFMTSKFAQTIAFSFNLKDIVQNAKRIDLGAAVQSKTQEPKISFLEAFTQNGLLISQLFGYLLKKKLKNQTIKTICQSKKIVRLNFQKFEQIVLNNWLDIKQYATYIPILFKILKSYNNTASPKTIDQYLDICDQNMNEFTFSIKSVISPQSYLFFISELNKVKKRILGLIEKQDLRETGFIQIQKVNQIFLEETAIQLNFLKQPTLIQDNLLNYQKFLSNLSSNVGQQYLNSGKIVKNYLLGRCSDKIIRIIRKAGALKKGKHVSKTGSKLRPVVKKVKNDKKNDKQSKKDTLIKQMYDKFKKDTSEQSKTKFLMVKQIILQLIFDSVEVHYKTEQTQSKQKLLDQQYAFKHIYTTDPIVSQNMFKKMYQQGSKILHYKNNMGVFIHQNFAYAFDLCKNLSNFQGQSTKKINLNLSSLAKPSAILDFIVFSDTLYLLRQDGLLYSWSLINLQKNSYDKMIQTSYKKNKNKYLTAVVNLLKKAEQGSQSYIVCQNVLKIDTFSGLIMINCTQSSVSRLQFYDLNLYYLGHVLISKKQFNFTQDFLVQAKFVIKNVIPKMNSDLIVDKIETYRRVMETCGWHNQKPLPFGQLLAKTIFSCDLRIIQKYCQWVLSYIQQNPIPLQKKYYRQLQRLQKQKDSKIEGISRELIEYLNTYNYISNQTKQEILRFKYDHFLVQVQNRKENLLTLVEDYKLELPTKQFLSRLQLDDWLNPCNLLTNERSKIISSLQCNPVGQFDIRNILENQHIQRLMNYRQQKYSPQNYKILELPIFIIKDFISLLDKGFIIFTSLIDCQPNLYRWRARQIKKIKINIQELENNPKNSQVIIKNIDDHNCLIVFCFNNILIYQHSQLIKQKVVPIRRITGFQVDPTDRLINMQYIYHQQTLVLLTLYHLQVYDMEELLGNGQAIFKFNIKPGYKGIAVSSNLQSKRQVKKKIISVGKNIQCFINKTKNSQSLIGLVMRDRSDLYLKVVYLSKYSLKVSVKNQFSALPQKLVKQLQIQSKRNWHMDQILYHQSSTQQIEWYKHVVEACKLTLKNQILSQKQGVQQAKAAKLTLIKQFNNYYNIIGDIKRICNKKLIAKCLNGQNQKVIKYQLLFTLITLRDKSKECLSQIFSKQFMQFYINAKTEEVNVDKIVQDITTAEDKKFVKRLLYIAALVYRFCFPLFNKNFKQSQQLIKNISADGKSIDLSLVVQVISETVTYKEQVNKMEQSINLRTSLRNSQVPTIQQKIVTIHIPEPEVIKGVISVFSTHVKDSLDVFINIALNFVPTQYLYLCPRYCTEFIKNENSQEWQEFNSNNFVQPISRQTFLACVKSQELSFKKSLLQFLQDKKKLKFVKDIICYRFPEANHDYRFLIDILQSYRILNLFQSIYLLTQYTNQTVDFRQSKLKEYYAAEYKLNIVLKVISDIVSSGKQTLPRSKITINNVRQLLSDMKLKDQQIQEFFYKQLKGNPKTKTAYTSELNSLLEIYKKNVSLEYNQESWSQLVGGKFIQISAYVNELCEQLQGVRILTGDELSNILQTYTQTNMEDLSLRCVYACMSIVKPQQQFLKMQQIKAKINLNSSYVNIQSFLTFIKKQKHNKLSNAFSLIAKLDSKQVTSEQIQSNLSIPSFFLLRQLYKCGTLLDQQELTHIVSFSTTPLSYKQYVKLIKHFPFIPIQQNKQSKTFQQGNETYQQGNETYQQANDKKQSVVALPKFIDPIQIKFIKSLIQKDSDMEIAWFLTQKHELHDFTKLINKLTVVDGFVSTKQIDMLMASTLLRKIFFQLKKYQEFVDFQQITNKFTKLQNCLNEYWLKCILFTLGDKFQLLINLLQQINRKQLQQEQQTQRRIRKPIKFTQLVKYFDLSCQFCKSAGLSSAESTNMTNVILSVIRHISKINNSRKQQAASLENQSINNNKSVQLSKAITRTKMIDGASTQAVQIMLSQFIQTLIFVQQKSIKQQKEYHERVYNILGMNKFQVKTSAVQYLVELSQQHQLKSTQFRQRIQDKDKYLITNHHIKLVLNISCNWYVNLKPMSKIGQFIQHSDTIIKKHNRNLSNLKFLNIPQSQKQTLNKLFGFLSVNKNKLSLQSFHRALAGQISQTQPKNSNFSQFYSKIRTTKSFSKAIPFEAMQIYDLLKSTNKQNKSTVDYKTFFEYGQNFISIQQRVKWIHNYIQLNLNSEYINLSVQGEDNSQKQLMIFVFDQLSNLWHQKLPILDFGLSKDEQTVHQIGYRLTEGFNYEQYTFLTYFDLFDEKVKHLISQLVKIDELEQIKIKLLQIFPQLNQIHSKCLCKYILSNKTSIKLKMQQIRNQRFDGFKPEQEPVILHEIHKFFQYFDKIQNTNFKLVKGFQNQFQLLYKQIFCNLPIDSVLNYYVTYHTFKQQVQKLLQFILNKEKYRKCIAKQIRRVLFVNHITPVTLFDLLGFQKQEISSIDKFHMYLSYFLNYQNIRRQTQTLYQKNIQLPEIDQFWSFFIEEMIKCFLSYDNSSKQITGMTPSILATLLNPESQIQNIKQFNQQVQTEKLCNYQELYKSMDVMGIGYVNINQSRQAKHLKQQMSSPYIKIKNYISKNYPQLVYLKPVAPNKQVVEKMDQIIQNLLKKEVPIKNSRCFQPKSANQHGINTKIKIISKSDAAGILSQYTSEHHLQYINQKFQINNFDLYEHLNTDSSSVKVKYVQKKQIKSQYLNLYNLIEWVQNKKEKQGKNKEMSERDKIVQNVIKLSQKIGGVSEYMKNVQHQLQKHPDLLFSQVPIKQVDQIISVSLDLIIRQIQTQTQQDIKNDQYKKSQSQIRNQNQTHQKIVTQMKNHPKVKTFQKIIKNQMFTHSTSYISTIDSTKSVLISIIDQYNNRVRGYDTTNNQVLSHIKKLSISQFKLLQKFFYSTFDVSMAQTHRIFKEKRLNKYDLFHLICSSSLSFAFKDYKMFTLLDLWNFMSRVVKSKVYSKKEVEIVFKIIDLNGDGQISYFQFVKFWSAVQQFYPFQKPIQLSIYSQEMCAVIPIFKIKFQILKNTIQFFKQKIVKNQQFTVTDLMTALNSQNKQKMYKLIEIIYDQPIKMEKSNKTTSEQGTNVNFLEKDKLKMIYQKIYLKVIQTNATNEVNNILEWVAKDVLQFINRKSKTEVVRNVDVNNLIKYIKIKYPSLGVSILSELFKISEWKREKLQEQLKIITKSKSNHQKELNQNNLKVKNNQKSFQLGVHSAKQVGLDNVKTVSRLKKFGIALKKKYQHMANESNVDKIIKGTMGLGQCLAYNMQFEQINKEVLQVQTQVQQCTIFVNKLSADIAELPVIYGVKPCQDYLPLYNIQELTMKSIKQKQLSKTIMKQLKTNLQTRMLDEHQQFSNICLERKAVYFDYLGGCIQKSTCDFNQYSLETTLVIDHDYKYKTNNRVTLLLNAQMYFDVCISACPIIDLVQLQQSKGKILKQITGSSFGKLYKIFNKKTCKTLKQYHIQKQAKFKGLPTMIKLVEMVYYIHKRYNVVGLLLDVDNLYYQLKNAQTQTQTDQNKFKIKQFFVGVVLDGDGNYTEGFDLPTYYSSVLSNNKTILPMPSQIYEAVYTESLDSYCLAFYLFSLFSGVSLQQLIQQQRRHVKQQKQSHLKQPNKIIKMNEQSVYDKSCRLHQLVRIKIIQLQKLIDKKSHQVMTMPSRLEQQAGKQIQFYTLILQCTKYQWYQRPKIYQILQCLHRLLQFDHEITQNLHDKIKYYEIITQKCQEEVALNLISANPQRLIQKISNERKSLSSSKKSEDTIQAVWSLQGLKIFGKQVKQLQQCATSSCSKKLKDDQIISIYQYYNVRLLNFIQSQNNLFKAKVRRQSDALSNENTFTNTKDNLGKLGIQSKIVSFGKTVKSNMQEQYFGSNSMISQFKIRERVESNSPTKLQIESKYIQQSKSIIKSSKDLYRCEIEQGQRNRISEFLQQVFISFMLKCKTKQTLFLTLNTYRNILQLQIVKKYLEWSDQKWQIKQFQLQQKLKLINMKHKIWNLPRNSLYYSDISLLMEHKITLHLIEDPTKNSKKLQSNNVNSKNLSLNYVFSIIISNNLNKIYALYNSQIIKLIYVYVNDPDLEETITKIYNALSKCYQNKFISKNAKKQNQTKKIDEVYKIMMVIYNVLSAQPKSKLSVKKEKSPKKQQGSKQISDVKKKSVVQESVVSMLQYINNYYTISGMECMSTIFQLICQQQLSHLLSLLSLINMNGKEAKIKLYAQTVKNLIKSKPIYEKFIKIGLFDNRSSVIYKGLKVFDEQIKTVKQLYGENQLCLLQLSESTKRLQQLTLDNSEFQNKPKQLGSSSQSALQIIRKNYQFYLQLQINSQNKLKQMQIKDEELSDNVFQLNLRDYNNINGHFQTLIQILMKIIQLFIKENNEGHDSQTSVDLKLLKQTIILLQLLLSKWQSNSSYVKIVFSLILSIYNQPQSLYVRNQELEDCIAPALDITFQLLKYNKKNILENGFVQFYTQLVSTQFDKLKLSISRQVENLQTIPMYNLQTQWRLSVFQQLLTFSQQQNELEEETSKKISSLGFMNYIVDSLLSNSTVMDLRYYKSNGSILPFRLCRPFKAEAIAMIGIALNKNNSKVQNSIIGKVIPLINQIKKSITLLIQDQKVFDQLKQAQKLQIVESIWLFSHISSCTNERMKYELINTGAYQKIRMIIQKYGLFGKFFPKLKDAVQSGELVNCSKIQLISGVKGLSKQASMRE